ncbi:DUF262 domain-containing protein [Helicobacter felistomachi]|uniref:DUF262 domain-containing protein n=1 Tax=Helicobacter felistomachi TaxID=3040201 RepID=UPI002573A822|nr:DUF262 domain-containing protein [Helicobacter sp. NHP21005]
MQSGILYSVGELSGLKFFIPAYQRGYRWTKKEVRALLKDIVRFIKKSKAKEDSYSLQPIVVKKVEGDYHVIDGQQRLTTIFLIVKYLTMDDSQYKGMGRDLFTLDYETRKDSFDFLQKIKEKCEKGGKLNIDFYHFKEAYEAIRDYKDDEKAKKKFFDDLENKQEFLNTLYRRCKLLWYESKGNEKEVFVRLNSGKIPLSEVEKIKALFLAQTQTNDRTEGAEKKEKQNEKRAKTWYETEKKARQNEDFIYCVLERVGKRSIEDGHLSEDIQRIGVYLKAIVFGKKKKGKEIYKAVPYGNEENCLFDYFYQKYSDNSIDEEWDKLNEAVMYLSAFASGKNGCEDEKEEEISRKIFHYLGFLIFYGSRINALYVEWLNIRYNEELTDYNGEFVNRLLDLVKKKFSHKSCR